MGRRRAALHRHSDRRAWPTKEQFTDFEFAFEWRHMKAAGNAAPRVRWRRRLGRANARQKSVRRHRTANSRRRLISTTSSGKTRRTLPTGSRHMATCSRRQDDNEAFRPASPAACRSLPKKHLCKPTGQWNDISSAASAAKCACRSTARKFPAAAASRRRRATSACNRKARRSSSATLRSARSRAPKAGQWHSDGWIDLFNGRDLAGWKEIGTQEGWAVDSGVLVAAGKAKSAGRRVG